MPSPTTLAIFLVILGSLCSILLLRAAQSRRKHVRKLPPGPRPLPIIGNLHMLTTLPHRGLQNLAKKYGPIMSLWLGQVPTVVVSSPEAAELFLKTNDTVFASRPKLCTLQLLSASKIEPFAAVRGEEVGSLVEWLKGAAAAREAVDVSRKVGELIADLSCRIILGRIVDDTYDLRGLVQEGMALTGAFNIADYVPYLAPFDLQVCDRIF
ncbi:Cytochrome P450, E-class, group I [Trema orientale]|uniref:Cytochrome P450, E-class, group I n=1 Tax=Trema orientale TaxID=63057 RepID=A0A2P5ABQ8_TREOI|nr:Cytochrome P450, E-class, group I [Trema orientale]